MRYKTFEKLILIFGIGAILATIILSITGERIYREEIFAQLLLIPVLIGGVHYGRSGGLTTALAAIVIYSLLRAPVLFKVPFPTLNLIIARAIVYALIGIGGGEICSRIKYFFAKLENHTSIDAETSLYNARHFAQIINNYANQFDRYETPFSLLIIDLNPDALRLLNQKRGEKTLADISKFLKNQVRAVDEIGRIEENKFGIIFPHTEENGALVATTRLNNMVNNYLAKQTQEKMDFIATLTLSYPKNKEEILSLIKS